MATTPTYAFPYGALSDQPDGATQTQALALALEAKFITNDALIAPLPKGRIASGARSGASATTGTTEAVVDSSTVTLVSGRRYRFMLDGAIVGVTGGNVPYSIQFRYQSGGTLTTGGTSFRNVTTNIVTTGNFEPRHFGAAEFVAPSSGTFTVGWTIKINTGTIRSDGGVYWHLDDIGI